MWVKGGLETSWPCPLALSINIIVNSRLENSGDNCVSLVGDHKHGIKKIPFGRLREGAVCTRGVLTNVHLE